MKLDTAAILLGIVGPLNALTDAEVRLAFADKVKATHPDTGGPSADMSELKRARDTLLNRRNVDDFTCRQCDGLGSVRSRMGIKPCGACKGTGETLGR